MTSNPSVLSGSLSGSALDAEWSESRWLLLAECAIQSAMAAMRCARLSAMSHSPLRTESQSQRRSEGQDDKDRTSS